jgi:hypothetical protein
MSPSRSLAANLPGAWKEERHLACAWFREVHRGQDGMVPILSVFGSESYEDRSIPNRNIPEYSSDPHPSKSRGWACPQLTLWSLGACYFYLATCFSFGDVAIGGAVPWLHAGDMERCEGEERWHVARAHPWQPRGQPCRGDPGRRLRRE